MAAAKVRITYQQQQQPLQCSNKTTSFRQTYCAKSSSAELNGKENLSS